MTGGGLAEYEVVNVYSTGIELFKNVYQTLLTQDWSLSWNGSLSGSGADIQETLINRSKNDLLVVSANTLVSYVVGVCP